MSAGSTRPAGERAAAQCWPSPLTGRRVRPWRRFASSAASALHSKRRTQTGGWRWQLDAVTDQRAARRCPRARAPLRRATGSASRSRASTSTPDDPLSAEPRRPRFEVPGLSRPDCGQRARRASPARDHRRHVELLHAPRPSTAPRAARGRHGSIASDRRERHPRATSTVLVIDSTTLRTVSRPRRVYPEAPRARRSAADHLSRHVRPSHRPTTSTTPSSTRTPRCRSRRRQCASRRRVRPSGSVASAVGTSGVDAWRGLVPVARDCPYTAERVSYPRRWCARALSPGE